MKPHVQNSTVKQKMRHCHDDVDADVVGKRKSISAVSVNEIAKAHIDESLSEPVLRETCQMVRDWCRQLLGDTFAYARMIKARKFKCTHLYNGDTDLLFSILRLNKCQRENKSVKTNNNNDGEKILKNIVIMPNTKYNKSVRRPKKVKKRKPQTKSVSQTAVLPKINAILQNPSIRWIKHEKAYLKPSKRILSREQRSFFQLITKTCLGISEKKRRCALLTLTTDRALHEILPTFGHFISNAVKLNVAKCNMSMLLRLMRMVRALVANKSLCLQKCLHQLIPAVLTCLLIRQDCSLPEDHWALREYSGNIIAEIVWHFDNPHNAILPRVIGIYKEALQKQALTTVYGAVIGLGKLGNYVIRACLVPQLTFISGRIEPHLKGRNGHINSNLNRQASRYIRHRILKVCTPILMKMHSPPDVVEKYALTYGFLGFSLCAAVTVSRIKAAAVNAAKREVAAARLRALKKAKRKRLFPNLNKKKTFPNKSIQQVPVKKPIFERGPVVGKGIAQQIVLPPRQLLQQPQRGQQQVKRLENISVTPPVQLSMLRSVTMSNPSSGNGVIRSLNLCPYLTTNGQKTIRTFVNKRK